MLKQGLKRELYVSKENYKKDLFVFKKNFYFACHVSEISQIGSFKVVNGFESSCIVIKTESGFKALANVCLHRGTKLLSIESGKLDEFICPYHSWRYKKSGELVDNILCNDTMRLKEYKVLELEGFLFIKILKNVSLNEEALQIEFSKFFKLYSLKNIKMAHQVSFEVNSNWKLLIENFDECSHCSSIHQLLSKSSAHAKSESSPTKKNIDEYKKYIDVWNKESTIGEHTFYEVSPNCSYWFGRYPLSPEFMTQSKDGLPISKLLGQIKKFDRGVSSFRLYPGFYLICNADYVISFNFKPISFNKTLIQTSWYLHETVKEGEYDLSKLTYFWLTTLQEDNKICEMQYEGVLDWSFEQSNFVETEEYSYNFDLWYQNELKSIKLLFSI